MQDTLLLNADFAPLGVVAWQRAVCMLLDEKVRTVETYPGRTIRSMRRELEWPAVVHLKSYVRIRRTVGPSRAHVLARDSFTCQYCGVRPERAGGRPDLDALTLDHVVPRAHSVHGQVVLPGTGSSVPVSSWENLVAACAPCNHRKADRTPAQAGMALRIRPARPTSRQAIRIALARTPIPEPWDAFLPAYRCA